MSRSAILAACILLCAAASARGQTQTPAIPTSVDVLIIPAVGDPNVVAPIAQRNTPIGPALQCNLAASSGTVPTPLINPTSAEFDDPFTAGRVCRVPLPVGLPNGNGYRGLAVLIAPSCQNPLGTTISPCPSVRSTVAIPPFNIQPIPIPPAAPTNLVVRP